MTSVISGVKIPDSKVAREAAELVRQYENEMLFNHSVRVYAFGAIKGMRQELKFDSELLYIAALFHDLGLVDHYHTQTKRFEVDGADAALADCHDVACWKRAREAQATLRPDRGPACDCADRWLRPLPADRRALADSPAHSVCRDRTQP